MDEKEFNDRDLLIRLDEKMSRVLDEMSSYSERIRLLELKVQELETRMGIYVAVASAIAGILGSIITKLF
jgi:hypothetical protein